MSTNIATLAERLDGAQRGPSATPQISAGQPLSLADAYRVQKALVDRRLGRGERLVGLKMGFTSRAKMIQMDVSDVIWGRLTDGMLIEDGEAISIDRYVHPRVEPEIAFLLKKPLSGRVTPLQAMEAVEAVAPALEVIDSRYQDFKFTVEDVVADNSSSAGFAVGPWNRPDADIANLGLVMSFDGRPQAFGSTAALLGHPLRSLTAASRMAAEHEFELEAGAIVMAGGATAASALAPGVSVLLEMERLGRVGFSVRT